MSTDSTRTEMPWTTRRLMQWITEFLTQRKIESPRICAELLLAHVCQCERTRLYMEVDRPASADELARLRALVRRTGLHEPVQYVVGESWFHARPFSVDRSTLIPRPATETLVELAVAWARARAHNYDPVHLLDLCTGSGCVVVSVIAALVTPRRGVAEPPTAPLQATAVASDLVAPAIALATRNATRHQMHTHIQFRVGDLYEVLHADEVGAFDLIVANPPYISDAEWDECPANVREYEPASALRGGGDGMRVVTPLVWQAAKWLKPGGRLFVEIAASHAAAARALVQSCADLAFCSVHKDHEALDRVLVADRRGVA